MPMIVSRKQRIYYQVEGDRGAFLLLLHGLFGSHEDWYQAGYVKALAPEFRLIIPDARGHGRSDRPLLPEQYDLRLMAEDLVEILNELGIRNTHVLGYSLGAMTGFSLLLRFRDRVRIAVLGGEAPFVTEPAQAVWRNHREVLSHQGLSALLRELQEQGLSTAAAPGADSAETRVPAQALLNAMSEWEVDPVERFAVHSSVTLFCGARDPAAERIEQAIRRIPRARLLSLPDLNHDQVFQEREQLLAEATPIFKAPRREPVRRPAEGEGPPGDLDAAAAEAAPADAEPASHSGSAEERESHEPADASAAGSVAEPSAEDTRATGAAPADDSPQEPAGAAEAEPADATGHNGRGNGESPAADREEEPQAADPAPDDAEPS